MNQLLGHIRKHLTPLGRGNKCSPIEMSGKEETAVIIKQIAAKFGMPILEAQSFDALCNDW